jgi:hypothetical protein
MNLLSWATPSDGELVTVWGYGAFTVTVLAFVGDGVDFKEVRVKGDAVTVGTLQDVKLGTLRTRIADHIRRQGVDQQWASREVDRIIETLRDTAPSRGRGASNPEWDRKIAQLYVNMLITHGERGVILAMAEGLGANPVAVSQWVHKSRKNGWIGPAPSKGRAGGDKGQRLIEWESENE